MAGKGRKSAKFRAPPFGGPTLRGPTLRGPTLRGPQFFWVRAPTPSGPPPRWAATPASPHQNKNWPNAVNKNWPNSVMRLAKCGQLTLAKCGVGQIRFGQIQPNKDGQNRFGQMRSEESLFQKSVSHTVICTCFSHATTSSQALAPSHSGKKQSAFLNRHVLKGSKKNKMQRWLSRPGQLPSPLFQDRSRCAFSSSVRSGGTFVLKTSHSCFLNTLRHLSGHCFFLQAQVLVLHLPTLLPFFELFHSVCFKLSVLLLLFNELQASSPQRWLSHSVKLLLSSLCTFDQFLKVSLMMLSVLFFSSLLRSAF